jgi:hypothetical protein
MPHESQLWLSDFTRIHRFRRMLKVVIYVYLTTDSLCRYYIVTLMHAPRLIHFSRVINLYIHSELLPPLVGGLPPAAPLLHGHLD